MFVRKKSISFIVFCMLLAVLCWQTPVRAASVPPTIDQIVGTYVVTDKEVYYYFNEGIPLKEKYVLTWRITQLSDSTVQVQFDEWDGVTFTAYYKNGFLVQSSHQTNGGDEVVVGIAIFSGKPGKIKFKGDYGWTEYGGLYPGDSYCEWDPFSGKMVSTDPGYVLGATLASQGEEKTVSVSGEGVLQAAAPPLNIDNLPGTYSCTFKGTLYYPTAGTKQKGKVSDTFTISKIDDETLSINSSEWNVNAHYGSGILMVADVDVGVLDPNASFAIVLAKGKPGKISLKGKVYRIMNLGTIDDEFEVAQVSCKQTSP